MTVFKSDGKIRIIGDYKFTLNPHLITVSYPIPRIQDILATIEGHAVQSKLDLTQAYSQIKIAGSSQPLTTLAKSKGLYKSTR